MSVTADDLILHHYEMSPFSEKIRKIFGAKNLSWFGVIQPNIAPKPDLTPLTGGYRRIPVLQIGAHIYCDTELMVKVIEARFPEPPLTPPSQQGVAATIADWADHRLFSMAAGPTVMEMLDVLPPEFMQDRAAMSDGFNPDFLRLAAPHLREQFNQQVRRLEETLTHSSFVLGDTFTLADASVFHVINFACLAPGMAAVIAGYPAVNAWLERVRTMGQGQHQNLPPAEALALARMSEPNTEAHIDTDASAGLTIGQQVRIQADDYGKEVTEGEIRVLLADEIAVLREDPDVGRVMVHYPRAGYRIMPVG